MDCRTEGNESNIDTEGDCNSNVGMSDEIELVFKPHPTEIAGDNQLVKALKENSVRYIKTTANATGKILIKASKDI
ncbi:E3 ubiquitin-protein ligase RING1-like [Lutzomyia longipalpis]|uniref:E3 ubiquitin-protein ligase RING1-like n=1 Tax=Lutzomyia longipalpis TaxID=7200 RepID=UPI0024838F1C|nr:E3 ubiquitin-protein ligase RING1-like [Lutzomyia longipalpis]